MTISIKRYILGCIGTLCLLFTCSTDNQKEIDNIVAFAHVYGLVRWFHPSDEAQQIDWNRFALHGVQEVSKCRSEKALRKKLEELFHPIAPGISFSNKIEDYTMSNYTPADTANLSPLAWQHYGVYLSDKSGMYESKRTNRPRRSAYLFDYPMFEIISPEYYKEKLKIAIKLKTVPKNQHLTIYLSLHHNDEQYSPKKGKTIINEGEWEEYEYEVSIDNSKSMYYWTIHTEGEGSFYLQQAALSSFENGKWKTFLTNNYSDTDITFTENDKYNYVRTATEGLKINTKDKLFEQVPHFGEYSQRKIGKQLFVHVPLVLYGDDRHTHPLGDTGALETLNSTISSVEKNRADIVVAWNVMKYFHPYLAELSINWDNELIKALKRIDTKNDAYSTVALNLMLAKLEDSHISWTAPFPRYMYPFIAKRTGQAITITHSLDPLFQTGDIVKTINGANALKRYKSYENQISGAMHVKNDRAALYWNEGCKSGESITVQIMRDRKKIQIQTETQSIQNYYARFSRQQTRMINDSILYINLHHARWSDLSEQIENRKLRQRIIFDIRNVGELDYKFINACIQDEENLPSTRTLALVPEVIYPYTPVLIDTSTTTIHPKKSNRNIFLVGAGNQSHHETYLDFLRYYGVACLVGTNTAGCNGSINYLPLPGGSIVLFTGMKFLSQLGSAYYYYRKGIAPDYYVEESIDDIKAGRDAVLEKAIEEREIISLQ
jgi:hypothetical protein